MEEEKLKHEIAYLHRQIRGLWREAPEHTFNHIKEYTRKNAFLDYNSCNNKACLKDVDWFAKIYYCSSECECQARQQKEALKRMEKVVMKQRYHQARQKRNLERKREEREEKRRKGREERIDKALEEERQRQEEKKQEELEQKEARERQRREETRRQEEMQRKGQCEKGYDWVNRGNGYYQCSGGSHWYHFKTTTKLHNLNFN